MFRIESEDWAKHSLIVEITGNPFGEIAFNSLLNGFTYYQIVERVNEEQLEFAFTQLQSLNKRYQNGTL